MNWIYFLIKGKVVAGVTTNEVLVGEIEATKGLLAYEHGVDKDEIEISYTTKPELNLKLNVNERGKLVSNFVEVGSVTQVGRLDTEAGLNYFLECLVKGVDEALYFK